MSSMIIMRGPSGSGKTTRAKELQKEHNAIIASADHFFMVQGEYCFNANKLPRAHTWCQERARCACEDDQNVIIDNTNMALWEMKPYVEMAESYGYKVQFKWGKHPALKEALQAMLEMGNQCFAMFNNNEHQTPPEVIFAQLAKLGPAPIYSPDLREILASKSPMEIQAKKEANAVSG